MMDHFCTMMSKVAQVKKPYSIVASFYNASAAAPDTRIESTARSMSKKRLASPVSKQKLAKLEQGPPKMVEQHHKASDAPPIDMTAPSPRTATNLPGFSDC